MLRRARTAPIEEGRGSIVGDCCDIALLTKHFGSSGADKEEVG